MERAEAAAAEGMGRGLYGVAMGGAGLVGVLQALVVLVMLLIPYSPQSKQVFVTLRKRYLEGGPHTAPPVSFFLKPFLFLCTMIVIFGLLWSVSHPVALRRVGSALKVLFVVLLLFTLGNLGHFRTSREAALIFGFSLFSLIVMTGIYHQLHRSIHLEHKLSRQRISLQRTTAQALTQERALAQLRLSLQQHEQTARNQQQEASRATKSSEAVVRQAQAQQREYLRLWEEKEQLQRQLDRLILEQSERKDGRAKKND
ncbi:hypothetical protein QOT17_020962 [Balamuthia mandrillaris]